MVNLFIALTNIIKEEANVQRIDGSEYNLPD